MSITPYCSITQWCNKQGYDDFDAFSADHDEYPTEDALTDILEECTQIINEEIGLSSTTNISSEQHTTYLRNLCYRMSMLMIDEEQGRAHEERRSQYIPRDYLFERDRIKLHRIGLENGSRIVGQIG